MRGEVRFDGRPWREATRQHWGYMPQERGLYPAMPAGEQAVYFGRLHGLSRPDAERRAKALLEELGLLTGGASGRTSCPGGLQQRLQLAAALVHDPEVIVLDEPFAGLDPVAVASLSESLRQRTRDRSNGAVLEPPAGPRPGPLPGHHHDRPGAHVLQGGVATCGRSSGRASSAST